MAMSGSKVTADRVLPSIIVAVLLPRVLTACCGAELRPRNGCRNAQAHPNVSGEVMTFILSIGSLFGDVWIESYGR